ncbi:[FeFe] hydrogenase H-cluster maturation GTPase HydF [Tenuifilum thalassicum]|uniref:[FeFe] hydrogenase H-cluster maturation GTPase HydF n=1 Tax=Tenuifilum thalassicum TaxID=2590900 RepID=A0A7D4BD40_9BACT|nr:[FeFe] hydrogenase H-cluster maturation GTPase HydF [Tenuifilum thalassicum]QKG78998.1 [FeFe] hydrogenase H-cluster maturation GTPase HydF [Tenuifilum thalassicum]
MQKGKESKPHIGIFGRRNNGKSSLINLLAGQDVAIVSDYAGTTTDPVKKSFEITGFGPVILIDTAGIDDEGELGEKRIEKTLHAINQIDLAILVLSANQWDSYEKMLVDKFKKTDTPFIIVHNKNDIEPASEALKNQLKDLNHKGFLDISCKIKKYPEELIALIKKAIPESSYRTPTLLGDLISYGDIVLLITPIDVEAPAGRLILPQVQAIRDVLDNDAVAVVLKEREVDAFLRKTHVKPALAVTDSQIFVKADASIPRDIPLTSFSILLARFKGDFDNYLKGTPKISELKDGDRILLLESCNHHVSCDDIGRVKIPRWISNFTGKQLEYDVVAGLDQLPRDIKDYSLVIQCGGCMITRKQIINRLRPAVEAGIPVTNYGMAIAYVQGIYNRAVAPFIGYKESKSDYL